MIPQKHSGGVEIDGLTGERNQFKIAANGKAFRILIDGLYSNKVQAVVRELWSNAADSHVAAGTPSRPFKCDIPTSMDPTFRVRDYGIGMDHHSIMELYTTLFESSKEGTNDETGMLGLGSKSPFAYTDTFSVIAYDGSTKRIYVANIGADGVPAITFLSTEPSTDERGIEVTFPVNRHDISQFVREAQWVSIGFKVKPEVTGVTLHVPTPRLSGPNWAIYPSGAFGVNMHSANLIRQGTVCYPNDSITVRGLASSWITIIDVPIGTADVVASRDLLSYTPDTRAKVQGIVERVGEQILHDIEAEIAKAKTRRQKAQVFSHFNGVMTNLKGSTTVSLMADPTQNIHNTNIPVTRRPGDVVHVGNQFYKTGQRSRYNTKAKSSEEVHLLDQVRLFVDYGTPMVRKRQRIKTYCARPNDFIIDAEVDVQGREVAVSWVIECWELKSDQVIDISTINDPGPSPKAAAAAVKKVLAPGQYWMLRKGNTCETVYGFGEASRSAGWPHTLQTAVHHLSPCPLKDVTNILYVTPLQSKKMGLPDSHRYDLCVQKELLRQANKLPINEALSVIELSNNLSGHPYNVVREQFFGHLTITPDQATKMIAKAKYAQIDLQTRTITASVRDQIRLLAATYPLLFGKSDKSVFETYIQQVQAATKSAEKEVQPA